MIGLCFLAHLLIKYKQVLKKMYSSTNKYLAPALQVKNGNPNFDY